MGIINLREPSRHRETLFHQIHQSNGFFWRGDMFLKSPQLPMLSHNKLCISLCALSGVWIPLPPRACLPMLGSDPPHWVPVLHHTEQRGCRGLRHKGITPFPGLFCLHLIQSSCGLLASFQINFGWPPPCPLPAARLPGSSPLNLQTNMGHIGWSNQLQTQLWKCQDVLFFCELQVYFVFGHLHLWASCLFFFPFQL